MVRARSLPLCQSDLDNLKASGLTRATIRANGLHTKDGALVFPYRELDGEVNCFARKRLHKPRKDKDGKLIRYEQPKGSGLRAYFPFASLEKLRDPEEPLFITEGEKKALALSQLGMAAVGIGGIWGGCKKGTEELIDDLAKLPLQGRVVYVVFDYDEKPKTRQEAEAAKDRLARAFKAAGSGKVLDVQLPPGPDGAKQGVDDFLTPADEEAAEAFLHLVEQAIPIITIIPGTVGGVGGNSIIKIIPPPVLGEAAYHGPLGKILRAVAPYTEATDAAVLAHLLPALGVYTGPGPHVWAGGEQPARVNTAIVGPTNTGRKGTAFVPVKQLLNLADPDFWDKQLVSGLSTGEGLIAQVAGPVEKRLYVVEPEFSKVLAQSRRDGNILSQVLRETFDSGNLSVMTRNNPLHATGAHIAVTVHITPEELKDRFNHIEMANGFGNRFPWFYVKSDKVMPHSEPIPDKLLQPFVPLVQRLPKRSEKHVPLADACKRRWGEKIYPSLREDKPGMVGAMLARGPSIVLRLSLIYYLLDPPSKGGSQGIQPAHLDAALAVWQYCEESVKILFRTKTGTFLGDKIVQLLAGGAMTKDQLNDRLSVKQKEEAGGVLSGLEAGGLIRSRKKEKAGPGRPSIVWEIVQ